jgi:hypothetical protein
VRASNAEVLGLHLIDYGHFIAFLRARAFSAVT